MGDSAASQYDAVLLPPPQPQTQGPTVGVAGLPSRTGLRRLPSRAFRGLTSTLDFVEVLTRCGEDDAA